MENNEKKKEILKKFLFYKSIKLMYFMQYFISNRKIL